MPLLIEIQGPMSGTTFKTDSSFEFRSDSSFIWEANDGIMRLSTENFAGQYFWSADILNIEPIAWRADNLHGGMCRVSGMGSIEIAMTAFDELGWWFPQTSYPCTIYYTSTDEGAATVLLPCTLHLSEINPPKSFRYDIYPENYDVDVLTEATNYDGETVVLPLALGTVTHVNPVRLADAGGGNQRYSAGGITGTKGATWYVYDDGVDICANATEISGNVFELSVAPVGEVTISGTNSNLEYLEDIFTYFCSSSYLNLNLVNAETTATAVDRWVTQQIRVIDFLSNVAASQAWFFFIINGSMYVRIYTGYATTKVIDVETDALDGTHYFMPQPISSLKYAWVKREAVEETVGKFVKSTDQEEVVTSSYPYGAQIEVDVFSETRSVVNTRLQVIEGYQLIQQISLSLPFTGELILPGTELTVSDRRFTGRETSGVDGYVRDVIYDFMSKKVTLEGHVNYYN